MRLLANRERFLRDRMAGVGEGVDGCGDAGLDSRDFGGGGWGCTCRHVGSLDRGWYVEVGDIGGVVGTAGRCRGDGGGVVEGVVGTASGNGRFVKGGVMVVGELREVGWVGREGGR